MESETVSWKPVVNPEIAINNPSDIELESLFRNIDHKNLVAPLREVRATQLELARAQAGSEEKRRAALDLQQQWEEWLVQRELLRGELKRGKDLLEQTQKDLAKLRASLEEWPGYERICGKNPLLEYMQRIAAQERVEQFLPVWLKRREAQLSALNRTLEEFAHQNGLEHML